MSGFRSRIMYFITAVAALVGLVSQGCERYMEAPQNAQTDQHTYFPLKIGQTWEYLQDSIVYDIGPSGSVLDSSQSWVKLSVVDTFQGQMMEQIFIVARFERKKLTDDWVFMRHETAERTATQAIWTEDNVRFLKIVFPFTLRSNWDGNIWIDKNREILLAGERIRPYTNWEYKVDSVDIPAVVGPFSFDSTLLITEADDENIIEKRFSRVRYAKHIGLVWREQWILDSQYCNQIPIPADCETKPWQEKAQKGYILRQTLVAFQ